MRSYRHLLGGKACLALAVILLAAMVAPEVNAASAPSLAGEIAKDKNANTAAVRSLDKKKHRAKASRRHVAKSKHSQRTRKEAKARASRAKLAAKRTTSPQKHGRLSTAVPRSATLAVPATASKLHRVALETDVPKRAGSEAPRTRALDERIAAGNAGDQGQRTLSVRSRTVEIKSLRFTGNAELSADELQGGLKEFVGASLAQPELRRLTAKVGEIYRQRGYLANAYVKPESVATGELELVVVESKLGAVRITEGSDSRLEPNAAKAYVTSQNPEGEALRPLKVDKGIRVLNEVPGVAATSAMTAGTEAQHTDVILNIKDKPLVSGSLRADNNGALTTGRTRVIGNVSINNPSHYGDQLTGLALISGKSNYERLGYEIPVGRSGLRSGAYLGHMSYRLDGALAALDNSGNATSWGAYASYPMVRDSLTSITATGAYDKRNLVDSSLNVRVMNRDTHFASGGFAGSHRNSLGLMSFGATLGSGKLDLKPGTPEYTSDQAGPRAAGGFAKFNWNLGQLLPLGNASEFAAMASGQFASKNLDSGEKFSLGGPTAIRAYSAFEGQGDDAWLTKLELRHNIRTDFKVLAFADLGGTHINKTTWSGWNATNPSQPNSYMLYGVGIGLNWQAPYGIEVQAALAAPIGTNPGKVPGSSDGGGFIGRSNAWISVQKGY